MSNKDRVAIYAMRIVMQRFLGKAIVQFDGGEDEEHHVATIYPHLSVGEQRVHELHGRDGEVTVYVYQINPELL